MKKYLLFVAIIFATLSNFYGGVIVIEGKYQNKNLYVLNGTVDNGVGFCTYEVKINGRVTTDEVNSSSFEIDFSQFQIKAGTPVIIQIEHKDDCSPKVINPEVLQPRATFEVTEINIDRNAILNWSTINETGSLPYIVEQFRWHKWVPVGEVKGTGKAEKSTYSFKTAPHSGENKFRVRQVGYGDAIKKSSSVTFVSNVGQPTYSMAKNTKSIEFSDETLYEIYDIYGNVVKRGYSNNLDISTLKKGNYYLCYDNIITDFHKKK